MKLYIILIIAFTTISFLGFSSQDPVRRIQPNELTSVQKIPFIKNIGQYPAELDFSTFCPGGQLSVDVKGNILYHLLDFESKPVQFYESFQNENNSTIITKGKDPAITKINFLKGKKDTHFSNIPTYNTISFGELWPGIFVELISTTRNAEKIFSLLPGSDPQEISIKMEHVDDLCIDEEGQLQVDHSYGSVFFSTPVAWQETETGRNEVDVSYFLTNNENNFQYGFVLGTYDKSLELKIDPILSSSFFGAAGGESAYKMVTDANEKIFIGGGTSSIDLPVNPEAFDQEINGTSDMFIAKFSADLSTLEACTFFGGNDRDLFFGMDIDQNGHIVCTGSTRSEDFPTTIGAYDNSYNGGEGNSITTAYGDIFISRFSNDLSQLEASTYIGGQYREWGNAVVCDQNNDIYVCGQNSSALPKVGPQFYNDFKGAFLLKMNNELNTLLATNSIDVAGLYGGPNNMCFDHSGNLLVVGTITFLDELQTNPASYDNTFNEGTLDAFILKLSPDLSQNLGATYFGGNGKDYGTGICVDMSNNIYITGTTYSNPFPVTADAYDTEHNCSLSNNEDAYVSKFDSALTMLISSTYIGGDGIEWWDQDDDGAYDIIYDPDGYVYVCGYTQSGHFPLSCESIDELNRGSSDAFVVKFNDSLGELEGSTLLGGSEGDSGVELIQLASGDILICGSTGSADFQVINGYDMEYNDSGDAFITRLSPDLINYTPCCTYPYPIDLIWADVDCNTRIIWEAAFKATGYYLSLGHSRENFDIIDKMDIGNVLEYDLMYLPTADTVYIKIDAYNEFGTAEGNLCFTPSITTKSPAYYYEFHTMCLGDTFMWEGFPMTEDGIYEVLHYAANGCDSIIHLNLEVIPCFHESVSMEICEGDSISWFDQYYYEPGMYFHHIESATGCDSTYELILERCYSLGTEPKADEKEKLIVYPNPVSNGRFYLKGTDNSKTYIQLTNSDGQKMLLRTSYDQSTGIDVSDLKTGVYFITIQQNQKTYFQKVFISSDL